MRQPTCIPNLETPSAPDGFGDMLNFNIQMPDGPNFDPTMKRYLNDLNGQYQNMFSQYNKAFQSIFQSMGQNNKIIGDRMSSMYEYLFNPSNIEVTNLTIQGDNTTEGNTYIDGDLEVNNNLYGDGIFLLGDSSGPFQSQGEYSLPNPAPDNNYHDLNIETAFTELAGKDYKYVMLLVKCGATSSQTDTHYIWLENLDDAGVATGYPIEIYNRVCDLTGGGGAAIGCTDKWVIWICEPNSSHNIHYKQGPDTVGGLAQRADSIFLIGYTPIPAP